MSRKTRRARRDHKYITGIYPQEREFTLDLTPAGVEEVASMEDAANLHDQGKKLEEIGHRDGDTFIVDDPVWRGVILSRFIVLDGSRLRVVSAEGPES